MHVVVIVDLTREMNHGPLPPFLNKENQQWNLINFFSPVLPHQFDFYLFYSFAW